MDDSALATFGDVHGVQAAQQVSDVQVVPLLPAHPVVAGEREAQVRPVHVGHHHPVQEPAGVHPRVIVLDPAGGDKGPDFCPLPLFPTRVVNLRVGFSHFTQHLF